MQSVHGMEERKLIAAAMCTKEVEKCRVEYNDQFNNWSMAATVECY